MRVIALFALLIFSVQACSAQGSDSTQSSKFATVVLPELSASLDFAGEQVPLQNYDTRESLLREITTNCYLHSRTLQVLLLSSRYFPIIEPILKKNGVPDDFKYLCVAESGLNPGISSPAGAAGLWQLMPDFARSAGLYMGSCVDERYHVEKATEAACKYLLEAKAKFGNWTLAAASYNIGMAGLSKRMNKQSIDNYYDLFLPEETLRYVHRILAFKVIMSDPKAYGYQVPEQMRFAPLPAYRETTVTGANIDFAAWATNQGYNYKILRELNPWIRNYDYKASTARTFTVRLPKEENYRK